MQTTVNAIRLPRCLWLASNRTGQELPRFVSPLHIVILWTLNCLLESANCQRRPARLATPRPLPWSSRRFISALVVVTAAADDWKLKWAYKIRAGTDWPTDWPAKNFASLGRVKGEKVTGTGSVDPCTVELALRKRRRSRLI